MKYQYLTGKIIKAFYEVYNSLGHGFLESVYEKALAQELTILEIPLITQQQIEVFYKGVLLGHYRSDIIVDDKIIVEIKAAEKISLAHEAQLINYLKATNMEVGLLLNFGQEPGIKRKIFY